MKEKTIHYATHADLDRSRICCRSLPSLIKVNLGHPVNFENDLETKIVWLKKMNM